MKKKFFYFAILLLTGLVIAFSCQKEEWTTATDTLLDNEVVLNRGFHGRAQVFTVEPTGIDDTENLQAAFDEATATGKYCRVVLTEGEYFTGPIVVEDFKGTLEGAGMGATIIQALPDQDVGDISYYVAPTITNPWPVLISFTDGDITIKDLRFQIDELDPLHWTYEAFEWESTAFYAIVMITGDNINSHIERVAFKGQPVAEGFLGYNVGNNILISSIFDNPWKVSGNHKVQSCTFNDLASPVAVASIGDANVTIGGSASKGNIAQNVYMGCEIDDVSNANVDVSYNQFLNTSFAGFYSKQGYLYGWLSAYPPVVSNLMIKNNVFEIGEFAWGVELYDFSARFAGEKRMDIHMINNEIAIQGEGIGIYANGMMDAMINSNLLTGTAYYGSYFGYGSNGCSIVANGFEGLATTVADVLLTGSTYDNRVVCGRFDTNVLDYGTNNEVVCPGMDRSDGVAGMDIGKEMQERHQINRLRLIPR